MTKLAAIGLILAAQATCSAGTVRWGHQLVTLTHDTIFRSMVTDSNDGVYLVISRKPDENSGNETKEYYLLKFNRMGEDLWSKPLAEPGVHLAVTGLAADGRDGVYVCGYTESSVGRKNAGKNDAFFAKYNPAGVRQWARQFGTDEHDVCDGLDVDGSGRVYVTGYTYGSLAKPSQGSADIFVGVYDADGTRLWQDQFGTPADDRTADLRLGDSNDLYLCGTTVGSLARGQPRRERFGGRPIRTCGQATVGSPVRDRRPGGRCLYGRQRARPRLRRRYHLRRFCPPKGPTRAGGRLCGPDLRGGRTALDQAIRIALLGPDLGLGPLHRRIGRHLGRRLSDPHRRLSGVLPSLLAGGQVDLDQGIPQQEHQWGHLRPIRRRRSCQRLLSRRLDQGRSLRSQQRHGKRLRRSLRWTVSPPIGELSNTGTRPVAIQRWPGTTALAPWPRRCATTTSLKRNL